MSPAQTIINWLDNRERGAKRAQIKGTPEDNTIEQTDSRRWRPTLAAQTTKGSLWNDNSKDTFD